MTALVINLRPTIELTDDEFLNFCQQNPELRIESTATGALVVMPPTGGGSGKRNAELTTDVTLWNRQTELEVVFDSSTVFKLPNGARRSPDVAWIANDRWNALTPEDQERFPPIAPNFVIELRSRTDDLEDLEAKMQEYMENGVHLGWLIDPITQQIKIDCQEQPVETLQSPDILSGETVLPEFVLDLSRIFR
ncbi:Uma2 family endonuclease [Leptolyngbya sp. FACHB-17]|uniref:Uma2 family endonuclease n=1 Tax=unclassified Leptolyngbya TaxID=2650499 RepID=UPI0016808237|nr:Uma2 family endonuclease [Leptolyngbya sp. FACHB-17]MBD2082298.1 Uma2 family endonuclease [Leptolyngbya sp. FACHB-17]